MKKLIKFQPNAKTYFEIAEDKYEEGDLSGAVYYFFQSYQKNRDIESLVALGETYCDMGEPEEGLRYLFLALDRYPDDIEICHSIAQCFLDMDNDETAFFYFQPQMTVKDFRRMMDEPAANEFFGKPSIRVLEKNDEMVLNIAVKLLSSGDTQYAKEVLLTIKPDSEFYSAANNLLSLSAMEEHNYEEGLEFAKKAVGAKDNVNSRSNLMLAQYFLGDKEGLEKNIEHIESLKLTLDEHRNVSLGYIRMGDAERAREHLRVLFEAEKYNRDTVLSYALALHSTGDIQYAKQLLVYAGHTYPDDMEVKEIAASVNRGDKLSLFPFPEKDIATRYLAEIEEKLAVTKDTGESFYNDESFRNKIKWLFSSRYEAIQSYAAIVLSRDKNWHEFLRQRLLDVYLDIAVKKNCLRALLFAGVRGNLGIVLDGMYTRLRIKYPPGMDDRFRLAYCLAFASFAFSDSCFESRLYRAAAKLLKFYNNDPATSAKIKDENALAAVIFYVTKHRVISDVNNCAQLFACQLKDMRRYIKLLQAEYCYFVLGDIDDES